MLWKARARFTQSGGFIRAKTAGQRLSGCTGKSSKQVTISCATISIIKGWTIERRICDWRAVARTRGTGENQGTTAYQGTKASHFIRARKNGRQEYKLPAAVNISVPSTMKSRRRRPTTKRHENITGNSRY